MKIAIMGFRGIPANYGGFETFVEEMAPRLVKRGHEVTVFGRSNIIDYKHKYYKGVRLVILPTISHKYLDTVVHTFLCVMQSFFTSFDVVLILNSANSIFSFIPRLMRKPVIVNVDGLEWQRDKWNWLGKAYYKANAFLATILPDAIITDARGIQKFYLEKFKKESIYIPYGAPVEKAKTDDVLRKYNLEKQKYLLYVSRMEPENNAHLVVAAFERVKTEMKLVMVGDAPYSLEYIKTLRQTRDPRIIFTGYVFGPGYRELQSNAYLYIQATEVGGTHPALLEGMGYGNCVLANDVPEHREVVADAGWYFSTAEPDDLRFKMQYLLDNPAIVARNREQAIARVRNHYSWDKVTQDYETLFYKFSKNGKYRKE